MPYLKTENYREPENHSVLSRKYWLLLAVGVVVLVGGFMVGKYFRQAANYRQFTGLQAVDAEVRSGDGVLEKISRHIMLPIDENPLIGTIENAGALRRDQPFFAAVEDGDIVLVYQKNARAILYRPKHDILVNVGPTILPTAAVTTSRAQNQDSAPRTPILTDTSSTSLPIREVVRLDIRNGSHTNGLAAKLAKIIENEQKIFQVMSVSSAARNSFKGTTLVLVTPIHPKQIDELKKKISITSVVSQLPSGEKKSSADIVIILGN